MNERQNKRGGARSVRLAAERWTGAFRGKCATRRLGSHLILPILLACLPASSGLAQQFNSD